MQENPVTAGVVVLLDVDDTLLVASHFPADLRRRLEHELDSAGAQRYWSALEMLRNETECVDYLGALQRLAHNNSRAGENAGQLLSVSTLLIDYPFAQRLYPRGLDVIRQGHCALDRAEMAGYTPADFTIDSIGELADVDRSPLTDVAAPQVERTREPA